MSLTQWPLEGKIEFVDYSMKYRDDFDFVLKNINCCIEPCEKVLFLMTKKIYFLIKFFNL